MRTGVLVESCGCLTSALSILFVLETEFRMERDDLVHNQSYSCIHCCGRLVSYIPGRSLP